jgi:RimJ/RimL family protein N-acetyltransferase
VDPIAVLETRRLRLRAFREEDLEPYARMCADPEVMRYLGDGRGLDRSEAWRQIALFLGHWRLRGYGLWAAELRETGRFIGRIGLWNPEGWPGLEVGWLVDRSHWGRGLATEGGRAALGWAFETLGAERVLSVIHPENAASIRVAEKLGERLQGTWQVRGIDVVVYGVERRASRRSEGAER